MNPMATKLGLKVAMPTKTKVWLTKLHRTVTAMLSIVAVAVSVCVAQSTLSAGLESPESGVVCNPSRSICYDRDGSSVGLTEKFLGHAAAEQLTSNLRKSVSDKQPATGFSPADGVECLRETGPCRLQLRPDAALTKILYGPASRQAGENNELQAILYGEWHWTRTRHSDDTEARPGKSENYVLRFRSDGLLEATVDCNSAGGKYRIEDHSITLDIINSTLMSCEADSLDDVFKQNLAAVAAYSMKGGLLLLAFRNNTGTMEFDRPLLHSTASLKGQDPNGGIVK
jgi:heat shock protein HslJ